MKNFESFCDLSCLWSIIAILKNHLALLHAYTVVAVKILQPPFTPALIVFARNWQISKLDRNGRKKIQTEVNLNKKGGFENLKKIPHFVQIPSIECFSPWNLISFLSNFSVQFGQILTSARFRQKMPVQVKKMVWHIDFHRCTHSYIRFTT